MVAVHACGVLTDACIAVARELRAPVATMPCCYTGTATGGSNKEQGVPLGVRRALGVGMAADVRRAFTLAAAGYRVVDFGSIPRLITVMNRYLVAEP